MKFTFYRLLAGSLLLSFVFPNISFAADDSVDLSVVGSIRFTVPGAWKVITSKSGPTQTIFVFQIPDPADVGTPDSTNLALTTYNLKDPTMKNAFLQIQSNPNPASKPTDILDGWNCSTFSGAQRQTTYSVMDCSRSLEQVGIRVRIAWPHLTNNPSDYDDSMRSCLVNLLESVVPYSSNSTAPNSPKQ